jgi:hypothetical protein
VEFRPENYYQIEISVKYGHKVISNSSVMKFVGVIIDETSWNEYIDLITTKLCSASYALRNLKHFVPQSTLRTVYYGYVHSVLSYSLIVWGSFCNANKVFIL